MVLAVWTPKGGSGCTVVSCALAVEAARERNSHSVVVDGCGDVPSVLGLTDISGPGVSNWLATVDSPTSPRVMSHAIATTAGVSVLAWGSSSAAIPSGAGNRLIRDLAHHDGHVVIDLGLAHEPWQHEVVREADATVLVLRPCYLALRRARMSRLADMTRGIILIEEPGRKISATEIESVLGIPVWSVIPWRAAIACAVDAGVLGSRLPEPLLLGARRVWASAPSEAHRHVA
ncbi:MAG: hypothetical protein WBD02_11520 [Acidimicrobiia bacterium]